MVSNISKKVVEIHPEDSKEWEVQITLTKKSGDCPIGTYTKYNPPRKEKYCRETDKRCLEYNCPHKSQQTL